MYGAAILFPGHPYIESATALSNITSIISRAGLFIFPLPLSPLLSLHYFSCHSLISLSLHYFSSHTVLSTLNCIFKRVCLINATCLYTHITSHHSKHKCGWYCMFCSLSCFGCSNSLFTPSILILLLLCFMYFFPHVVFLLYLCNSKVYTFSLCR